MIFEVESTWQTVIFESHFKYETDNQYISVQQNSFHFLSVLFFFSSIDSLVKKIPKLKPLQPKMAKNLQIRPADDLDLSVTQKSAVRFACM